MAIAISQEAFDAMVRENMEDLGMDADEALADAVEALTLQGADLSGNHQLLIRSAPSRSLHSSPKPLAASCRDHQARARRGRRGGGEPDGAGAGRIEGFSQCQWRVGAGSGRLGLSNR